MAAPGRILAANDEAGVDFVFLLCLPCTLRLSRLPRELQQKAHARAIRRLASSPEHSPYRTFTEAAEARLFVALAAELEAAELLALFE